MIRLIVVAWLLVAGGVVVSVGCATGEPQERAMAQGASIVHTGVADGIDAVEAQDTIVMQARYNPCRCPAPDFEIHLRGQWRRVIVGGPEHQIDDLRQTARAMQGEGRLEDVWLTGQFDGQRPFDDTGVDHDYFEVLEFQFR